jgi:hypothetical protein
LLIETSDPNHPRCAAFRREHRSNRTFTQLAAQTEQYGRYVN